MCYPLNESGKKRYFYISLFSCHLLFYLFLFFAIRFWIINYQNRLSAKLVNGRENIKILKKKFIEEGHFSIPQNPHRKMAQKFNSALQ